MDKLMERLHKLEREMNVQSWVIVFQSIIILVLAWRVSACLS